jgi:uncharacterized protein (TIGR03435 family)
MVSHTYSLRSHVYLSLLLFVAIAAFFSWGLEAQAATQKARTIPEWVTVAGVTREFDVASVKESKAADDREESNFPLGPGDVYAPTNGVFSARAFPLIAYVAFAYKITNTQNSYVSSQLPDWARSNRYDIEARSGQRDVTKDQMRLMMQSLLADRFKLTIHTEIRQVPVLALVLSKAGTTGPQLRPHPANDDSCSTAPSDADAGMFPVTCGGILGMSPVFPGDTRAAARNISMDAIASFLSGLEGGIDRPVVNRTGLAGNFDFNLEWAPESNTPSPIGRGADTVAQGPSALEALKKQLGLKLKPMKGPVEWMIIDHVERFAAN